MREVTNARDKTEGDLFPHSSNSFKHRARMNARILKSSSNRRNAFRENTNETRRAQTFASSSLSYVRKTLNHEETQRRNKERAYLQKRIPGRTPRRCTIDRRNNPSRSRPRRIKKRFRWNLRPRLRLSRLGTRPSERRFELGRGNPFVRGVLCVCACVLRVEILKETLRSKSSLESDLWCTCFITKTQKYYFS